MPSAGCANPNNNMLEKDIEKKVCDYAKKLGFYVRKFTSPAQRAVPDRLFINPHGVVFFIEFKQKGKKPTPLQEHEHKQIRENEGMVFIVDSVVDGLGILERMKY